MKRWIIGIGVAAAIAAAGTAMAQKFEGKGHGGPDHGGPGAGCMKAVLHDEDLARAAGVTDEQIAKLKASEYETQKSLIKLRSDLDLARLEMRQLMEQDAPDLAAVEKAIDKMGGIQTEIRKVEVREMIQAKTLLGPETSAKLRDAMRQKWQERQQNRRGGRGPEGCRGEGSCPMGPKPGCCPDMQGGNPHPPAPDDGDLPPPDEGPGPGEE